MDFIACAFALYRAILLTHFRGSFLSKNSEKGTAIFTINGVVKVVTAETATTIGYKKSLVTFNDIPKVAIIKENSPICAKVIPIWMDCFKGCPEISEPIIELVD